MNIGLATTPSLLTSTCIFVDRDCFAFDRLAVNATSRAAFFATRSYSPLVRRCVN